MPKNMSKTAFSFSGVGRVLLELQDNSIAAIQRRDPSYLATYFTTNGKSLIGADVFADAYFNDNFVSMLSNTIVCGEENLDDTKKEVDLSRSTRRCLLVDLLDGTDLLVRDLANWCSAVVAFHPSNHRITASYILTKGGNSDRFYFCEYKDRYPRCCMVIHELGARSLGRPSEIKKRDDQPIRQLSEASICTYAQKAKNVEGVLKLKKNIKFRNFMRDQSIAGSKSKCRFYNMAGNPMIAKILDGDIDVVFDVGGQAPHDVVPGAYLALRGGATMIDLGENPRRKDREIEEEDLLKCLYRPAARDSRMKYVIAGSRDVAREISEMLVG